VREIASGKLAAALATHEKHARSEAVSRVFDEVWTALSLTDDKKGAVRAAFEEVESAEVRRMIVERGLRVDGRKVTEIRPISTEVAYLPRAHGSSLFTRGETQALVSATLGTKADEQKIEALEGESYRHFLLHYNFPSFSVGEGAALRLALTPGHRSRAPGRARVEACCRPRRSSRTRSAWSPTSSSPTARRRWPACAAPRSR
jgi:polyribonucleotide nucleotidyltransferase